MKIINLPKHLSIVASLCIACQAIITKMPYTVNLDGWTDKTATAIEAQFSDNNFAGTLTKSNFQVLFYMDLKNILFEAFERGLPSDMQIAH